MASFTKQSPFAGHSQTYSKCNFLTKYAVVWQGPYKLMPQVVISYYRYYVTFKKKNCLNVSYFKSNFFLHFLIV